MTQQHPISPPPELVKQWREQAPRCRDGGIAREDWLMTRAAQWGADQELDACCEWIPKWTPWDADQLRAHRRPQPPSLKELALLALSKLPPNRDCGVAHDTIRRALEQLDD